MATIKNAHVSNETEVDLSKTSNSLWLVKVPNYLARKWENRMHGENIGTLKIVRRSKEISEMSLCLLDEKLTDVKQKILPKEYRLNVEPIKEQLMTVYAEEKKTPAKSSNMKIAGYLSQKVNVILTAEASYMDLKKDSIREAFIPKRTSMQLDNIVKNFKPKTDHAENIENRKKLKGKVRKCKTQEEVMAILFEAFSKQRFYNIRDLIRLTAEPIAALKIVLKEICDYNVRNPNRNMWQLKAEYRPV